MFMWCPIIRDEMESTMSKSHFEPPKNTILNYHRDGNGICIHLVYNLHHSTGHYHSFELNRTTQFTDIYIRLSGKYSHCKHCERGYYIMFVCYYIHYRYVITSDVFVVVAIVLITAFHTNFGSIHYHFHWKISPRLLVWVEWKKKKRCAYCS